MNKMKKLLSVLLAVVLAFSALSVLGSAAKTPYKTVAELEALDAYSPYGQVTRLAAEERMSIIGDTLDILLMQLNINMGTVLDVLGLTVTINLTSIDNLCASFDSFKSTMSNFLYSIAKGIVNLGVLEDLSFSTWQEGMTRDGTAQLTIAFEIFELLSANTAAVDSVLSNGLELGIIAGFIGNLDLSGINELVTDLPSLIKGMLFPMFERWDQTIAEVNSLEDSLTGNGKVLSTLDWVVNNFFTRPMSLSTVKADANGNMTSAHTLPGGDTHRRKFVMGAGNKSIDVYQYYTQSDVDDNAKAREADNRIKELVVGYNFVGTYYLEEEMPGSTTYVYKYTEKDLDGNVLKNPDGTDVKTTLKHYEDGSYWLPEMVADGVEFHVTQETGIDLLYKMIPYVFDAMAPVVINGSVQKLLAGLFGVKWTNLGYITDEAVLAKVQALPGYDASMPVFGEQGEYLWEWSAFGYVENGEATNKDDYYFYRYEDQIFVGDASHANDMIEIIKWGWEVDGTFMNEFIPGNAAATAAGNSYTHLMMSFNNFLVKAANLVLDYDELGISAPVWGDNSNLVSNVKNVAQGIIKYAPETIFGTPYEGTYYDLISSTGVAAGKSEAVQNDLVLTGIAALLIDALAPQAHMPKADSLANQEVKLGGLLAAMVRELATQILPSVDYDSLIYTSYDNGVFLSGKTNSYWLDVLMTIATDLGLKYLTAFADMWEDGAAWTTLGYSQNKTYALADFEANPQAWENKVDYIIDWALTVSDGPPVWNMLNLIDMGDLTINMATNEDPWLKLDKVLDELLFLDQFTSETDLEVGLRGTILDLVDLNWGNILGTPSNAGIFDIPSNSKLRTTNLVDAVSLELRDLINGLFKKIGGGSYELIPSSSVNNLDDLANQTNIKTIAVELVGHIVTAYNNGLLHTALPFLNFFIGWKMDPQVIADPIVNWSHRDGNDYAFIWASSSNPNGYPNNTGDSSIKFTNNSSGMLEKHRDTTTVDHEYAIKILSVTNDASKNTVSVSIPDDTASPYETITMPISINYTAEEAVKFTIKYQYIGKDGNPVGGELEKVMYTLFSNSYEDSNPNGHLADDEDKDYAAITKYKAFYFVEDIQNFVTTFEGGIAYKKATIGINSTKSFSNINYPDTGWVFRGGLANPNDSCDTADSKKHDVADTTYFTGITDRAEAGWASSIDPDNVTSTSGKLYKLNTNLTEEEMPYGAYQPGAVGVKYGSDTKVFGMTFVHINDYDIGDLYNKHMGYDLDSHDINASDTAAATALANYQTALKDVVKYATYPMKTNANQYATTYSGNNTFGGWVGVDGGTATLEEHHVDYVADVMPKIEPAMEALETAYEALKPYLEGGEMASSQGASTAELEAFLEEEGKDEVNFQDYAFYEYFNFADRRTAARNLVKGLYAPEVMDQYYIEGSGIRQAELQSVIDAEANENIAAGITASRSENDPQAVYDSQVAHDTFVAPEYTDLFMDDQVALLKYYKQFALNHPVAADMKFIEREIQYAEYNYPMDDEALYTEASWAKYEAAYNTAVATVSSQKPSEVFGAKYDLMVAMKGLLLKSNSANLNYEGYDRLLEAQAKGDELLAIPYAELVLTEEAVAAGYTVNTALAEVVKAYGYYYVGEDGNTWNLYNDSVLEYLDNDRPNKSTNWRRMDAASGSLNTAVALFENMAAPSEPNTLILNENAPFEAIIDTTNCGDYNGTVYGFDTLGYNDMGEIDGTIADFLSTAYGDEYLEVVVGDSGVETTGTLINVLDEEGNVVETYVYVYFGDVDMDGYLTSNDGFLAEEYEFTYEGLDYSYQLMAVDVDGDGMVSSYDGSFPQEYEFTYEGMPTQAEIAQNVMNNYYEL